MSTAYLVGHGDALGPGTPGGNPVGNALDTAMTLDQHALERQRQDLNAKMLQRQQDADEMKSLGQQLELVGTKSPAGQQIMGKMLGKWGITYDPSSVDPQTVATVTQNALKGWAQVNSDPSMSPDKKAEWIFEHQQAAIAALNAGGGTKSERAAGMAGIKSGFDPLAASVKGEYATSQDNVRADHRQTNALSLEQQRLQDQQAMVDYKNQHPSDKAGGRDVQAEAYANAAARQVASAYRQKIEGVKGTDGKWMVGADGEPMQPAPSQAYVDAERKKWDDQYGGKYPPEGSPSMFLDSLSVKPRPTIKSREELIDEMRTAASKAHAAALEEYHGRSSVTPSVTAPTVVPTVPVAPGAAAPAASVPPIGLPKAGTAKPEDVMAAADAMMAQFNHLNPNPTKADIDAKLGQAFKDAGYVDSKGILPDFRSVLESIATKFGVHPGK